MSDKDYFTIGEVVRKLSVRYPDLSVSKLRFLDEEGLISPERTPAGYRKFLKSDVERVEVILKLQREYFYPLEVIRTKLAELDAGQTPKEFLDENETSSQGPLPLTPNVEGKFPIREAKMRMGISDSFLMSLAEYGIIELEQHPNGKYAANCDIPLIEAAWALRQYGVEPRLLKMYVNFSRREAELYGRILRPTYHHKTAESRDKLNEALTDISVQTDILCGHLTRRALVEELNDLL